jgi:hypothetical protein
VRPADAALTGTFQTTLKLSTLTLHMPSTAIGQSVQKVVALAREQTRVFYKGQSAAAPATDIEIAPDGGLLVPVMRRASIEPVIEIDRIEIPFDPSWASDIDLCRSSRHLVNVQATDRSSQVGRFASPSHFTMAGSR